jgi:hypothetical protein
MMRNVKFLLPMLAFICAIGMAFATVDLKPDPESAMQAMDYILVDGSWEAIPEENCTGTGFDCSVQLGTNGPIYQVFDEPGDAEPKPSGTDIPRVIQL